MRVSSRLHVLADEGERVLGHALHLVERGDDLRPGLRVLDELGVKTQARDRRSEVVGDRGEHRRAVADVAVEPCAHEVERAHRVAGLDRPGLGQVHHRLATAEAARPPFARPRIGFASRRPVSTATAAMPKRREEEGQHEGRAPGGRAGRRPHRHVQPAPVLEAPPTP